MLSILISKISNDNPSPSAKSASPPRSAKDNNLMIPGALITLKFSISSFELDDSLSIIDVNKSFPPAKPLKKLYCDSKGFGKSE